jgi:hypothetical protein
VFCTGSFDGEKEVWLLTAASFVATALALSGTVLLLELGNTPVIAATPIRLTSITDTAAPATSG